VGVCLIKNCFFVWIKKINKVMGTIKIKKK